MIHRICLFFLLSTSFLCAQNTIKGSLVTTEAYEWVILYELNGAKQLYLSNATVENGSFQLTFPEDAVPGMYRLMFSSDGSKFLDLIYNKESVALSLDPTNAIGSVEIRSSEENKAYYTYLKKALVTQERLDQLQYSYFREKEAGKLASIEMEYESLLKSYFEHQVQSENSSSEFIAHNYIKARNKYYSSSIIKEPQLYLNSEKQHFFEFIDFDNEYLLRSTMISEHVINYLFYLNRSDDIQTQTVLFKNALNIVMDKIGNNSIVKKEVLTISLHAFAQIENAEMVTYTIENHYNDLPEVLMDHHFLDEIRGKVKLAIGQKAPNFEWSANDQGQQMYSMDIEDKLVLVFWSSTCPHCLEEVPQLYEYVKDKPEIKVIAIALEKDDQEFSVYKEKFKHWTNVLGLQKWDNPIARLYEVNATPSYFILNKNKTILAKPEYFSDLELYFESQK